MAENIEKRLKIELPDGRKGNVSESKLEGLKNKYPELKIVGYMDGSAYETSTPTQEQTQQEVINISDASMPMDSVQMMGNTAIGTELPPVDANNEDILAQQYAQQQLKANAEEAYQRMSAQAKPIYDKAISEQIKRNTFDTENKEGKSFFRRLVEFTGRIAPRGGNRVNFADDIYFTNNEVRDYTDALSQLSDAKNLIKDAEAEKDGTYVGGFARGAKDKLFDIDTWTGGVSESLKSQNLQTALDKFESGKELTEGEEALLEATAINSAVSELYSGMLGRGYQAGQVTAESIPFMIEMMSNPATGFGNATSKRLARWAVSKGLGSAATKAVGYGGRLAGDIIGSNLMSMTTGSGRVVAGALDRDMGRLNYALDEDGAIKFTGAEGSDDSFIRSLAKSYGANTISNFSEMLGAYFAPLSSLGKKGMGKLMKHFPSTQKVEDVLETLKLNDIATFVKQMDKETQLSGVFGEFTEEIADGLMQGIIVDGKSFDETAKEVFDKDNLINTLLGVSFFGGVRTLAKTAGAARYGFDLAEMYKDRAEKQALRSGIDEDTWNYEKGKIDTWSSDEYKDNGYEELVSYLNQRSTDDAFTADQKVALFNYAKAVQQAKGVTLATQKAQEEGIDTTVAADENEEQNVYSEEQQSPLELNDEETVLANLGLTGKDNIRYQKIEDGKRIYTNSVITAKITDENGEELNGYLLRESQGVEGLSPVSEVMIIGNDGKAYKAVVKSDKVKADDAIDDSSFFSSVASQMREAKEDEIKRFNEANQDSIEQEMTPEQRLANRRATFNEKVRSNPNYDEQVYQSSFDLRGQKLRNLTEEQSFVVDMKENGLETAIEDIFYQRGLIEKAIDDSITKESKMKSEGKDISEILKERDKRRGQQRRLDDINKIIDERGLSEGVDIYTSKREPSTMVPAVEEALEEPQKPQTMLESIKGVLGGEREAVDKKYIDKSSIPAPSEQNPILDTYNSIPRDKSGKVKIKDLSPSQMYSKVFVENGEQAANEMLQEEVDSINEEITKLREELPKKKGLQKVELYDKIGELESRLNSIQAIRPEQTAEAASTPEIAPETALIPEVSPETEPVAEPEATPEPEVETEPEPQPEPIPDAEPKVVEEPVSGYTPKEEMQEKEKSPNEVKAKALPKSMKELKKLSGEELKDALVQMMQKGLIKFGSKRSWVEMFGERLENVKDINALMKKIDASYESKKQLYLAVRDLRSLVKGTASTKEQTKEEASPAVNEPKVEYEKKDEGEVKSEEKPAEEKKKKKHIPLKELREMSPEDLKNALIELAKDGSIKIYYKNKGVKIGKTIYSIGVINELLSKIDPTFKVGSVYQTKQKLREVANMPTKESSKDSKSVDNSAKIDDKAAEAETEDEIVDDSGDVSNINVVYNGKEISLASLIETYNRLYTALEQNNKKADTAIGSIAKKHIPEEMKSILKFLSENGIDSNVLNIPVIQETEANEEKGSKEKAASNEEVEGNEEAASNEEIVTEEEADEVESDYEIITEKKDGKNIRRVLLNSDDYLRRQVYWKRVQLKEANDRKDEEAAKRLGKEIEALNRLAQQKGLKSNKDDRKGDAQLAKEYEDSSYGKREIAYYNDEKTKGQFEFGENGVIEMPQGEQNWIPRGIKKIALEMVKQIPNLQGGKTTERGIEAIRKIDDKNNLFVRVDLNGVPVFYYGSNKQPDSKLFKPIDYKHRRLTSQEKDFTKESIDSYFDYLSINQQIRDIKIDEAKDSKEKKALLDKRTLLQQKRDAYKNNHIDEIKEWQSKSSMRYDATKQQSASSVAREDAKKERESKKVKETESKRESIDSIRDKYEKEAEKLKKDYEKKAKSLKGTEKSKATREYNSQKKALEKEMNDAIQQSFFVDGNFDPKAMRFSITSGGSNTTRRATISEVSTLSRAIAAVFPKGFVKVNILSDKKFNEVVEREEGRSFANDNGDVCGVVTKDGTVYINQDKARIDTPLHEIGIHKLVDLARATKNEDMLRTIFEYAKSAPQSIIEEVKKRYPKLDTEKSEFWEEVAAMAFGLQNEGRLEAMLQTEAEKTWWKKLVEAVKNLWNKIAKTEPTYKDMSLYQGLSTLGHEEIGNKLFDMLTSEDEINLGKFNVNDLRYKAGVPKKVKEYKTVQIFGGIWIDSEEEYAKFVSAVNMSPFEENGEGIAYTDNHFYAYYRNIEGEPIPYYDIYLNAEQSQEVIKQVKEELRNGSKNERNQLYIDRATKLVGNINSKNNDYNGDNNSVSNSRRNDTLGSNILRKGRYADNPSLYVKTSRTDGVEVQDVNYSFLQDNDSIDEIASYSALEALRESGLDIDSYDTSDSLPNTDELINDVLTRKGEERMQRASRSVSAIQSALTDADCPESAHPAAWINYLSQKGAIDTKNRNGLGQNMYQWLSSQNSVRTIKRDEIIKQNQEQKFKDSPFRQKWDKLVTYFVDTDQAVRQIQDEIKRLVGLKKIDISEDFVKTHNLESSRIERKINVFENTIHKALNDAYRYFAKYNDEFESNPIIGRSFQDAVDRYLFALHAKERNRKINIDNLVDAAMDYAKNIEIKKTDLEMMLRVWITNLYDNHFVSPNGVSKTEFSDNIDPKWKRIAENVERKVLSDLNEVISDNNQSGEDLSDSQADEYISEFESIVNEAETETLKIATKNATEYILDEALESGLISQDTYNIYKNQYQHYVPLRGWEDEENMDSQERLNDSFYKGVASVTGEAEVEKKAKGRKTAAAPVLGTLLLEAQDTIVRGERNRTLNALVNLYNNYRIEIDDMVYVSENEDIDKEQFAPAWVREMAKMNMVEGEEHTIGVKINGQRRRLFIAGDNGRRFIRAYKSLDSIGGKYGKYIEGVASATKRMSRLFTTYNPKFWVSNVERDISGGVRNMYIQRGAKYSADLAKNFVSSLREVFDANVNGKESDMYKLYLDNGGSIGFYKQKDTKEVIKNTKEKAEKYIENGMTEDKAWIKAAKETITNLASVTEDMTRYATFKTAVENGEKPAEAAYLAHEITTNLSRRGSQREFSSLYSFFNPTIQGVAQMVTAFANPDTRKRAAVAYGADFALTAVSTYAMMALSAAIFNMDRDDDEEIDVFDSNNPYWSIDENVRLNTVAIPIGIDENGIPKCILFQRPHQYRMTSSIIDYAFEYASGKINGKEFMNKYLKRVISETAPFNSGSYSENGAIKGAVQQFMPSVLRPLVDVAFNANAFGGKIRREKYDESQPEYMLSKGSGIKVYTSISKALNALGGGSTGIRGSLLQINPDSIKYLVESYTGFAGQLVHSVTNSLTRNEAEKKRYGGSFANIFGNIYWENRDGAMYQSSEKLREYADQYVENLLNNPNPHLIKEFINDKKTMDRVIDKATIIANAMYSEYKKKIKELENSWNIVLSDDSLPSDEQNAILESILDGLVEVNTGLGKGFEDVLNQVIKEEKR